MSSATTAPQVAAAAAATVQAPVVVTGNTVKKVEDTIRAGTLDQTPGQKLRFIPDSVELVKILRTDKGEKQGVAAEHANERTIGQRAMALIQRIVAFITGKFRGFLTAPVKHQETSLETFAQDSMEELVRKYVIALRVQSHLQDPSLTVRVKDPQFTEIKGLGKLIKGPEFEPLRLASGLAASIAKNIASAAAGQEEPAEVVEDMLKHLKLDLQDQLMLPGGYTGHETPTIRGQSADTLGHAAVVFALNQLPGGAAILAKGLMQRLNESLAPKEGEKGENIADALAFLASQLEKLNKLGLTGVRDAIKERSEEIGAAVQSAIAQVRKGSTGEAKKWAFRLTQCFGPFSRPGIFNLVQIKVLIDKIKGEDETLGHALLANLASLLVPQDRRVAAGDLAAAVAAPEDAAELAAQIMQAEAVTPEDALTDAELAEMVANKRLNSEQLNAILELIRKKSGLLSSRSTLQADKDKIEQQIKVLREATAKFNPKGVKAEQRMARLEKAGVDGLKYTTAVREAEEVWSQHREANTRLDQLDVQLAELNQKLETTWLALFPAKRAQVKSAKIEALEAEITARITAAAEDIRKGEAVQFKREHATWGGFFRHLMSGKTSA